MQELNRFDGMVIVSTNLFQNYAPVLPCRIQRHIHFRLPNASMHGEFFSHQFPNPQRAKADDAVLATQSRGLSGGDILNTCVNSIHAVSVDADPATWAVTQAILEWEIAKVKKRRRSTRGGGRVSQSEGFGFYRVDTTARSGTLKYSRRAETRPASRSSLRCCSFKRYLMSALVYEASIFIRRCM
jgi:hypothetical protein